MEDALFRKCSDFREFVIHSNEDLMYSTWNIIMVLLFTSAYWHGTESSSSVLHYSPTFVLTF